MTTNVNEAPISDAESTVMQVLWQHSPRTAEEVLSALADKQDWALSTVKTLLNRLLRKGAITAERDGRRFLYAPKLSREDWLQQQSAGLLDRLFDGRVAPLVAHFCEHRKLSPGDIAELRKLIERMDDAQ
ncbi:MAG: BlaI/MecI/CopY family transcriptional regulator [Xanthomonadaceae bacterium]|nr:BlaI/MecI/CopY family transcriptional regulator [Xanthomonadaceae bacterium]MDP2184275.1 BlaI/MecI/CopY family transcriptional regulator [Xanthomonadales bacterium]MDZ4114821.1 BlaI/MecI/CopY family transcriptional regulator [Xanthomonadaceae bacterium]MDZ4377392.1 BlaI/MecI/CopY family transcriptional regulator [Xanthomonadaceae bacterium]